MCQGVNEMLQTRLERATAGLGNRCSIHLSYWSSSRRTFVTIASPEYE